MKCKVKRDEQGRFLDVVDPTTGKSDSLYKTILSKVTKDPESYIAADEFIQNLYNTNVLVDKTKEEVALGIWAKVHQYWLNTGMSPVEKVAEAPVQASPQPAKTINIYSTDKNGYEKLSNLLNGPITTTIAGIEITVPTVEHLYQIKKAYFAKDKDSMNKILAAKTGWDAQKLGRDVKGLDSKAWDKISSAELESAMRLGFEQNPQNAELLLSIGNAQLTHTKANLNLGKWEQVFPEILMRIREDLNEPAEVVMTLGEPAVFIQHGTAYKFDLKDDIPTKGYFRQGLKSSWEEMNPKNIKKKYLELKLEEHNQAVPTSKPIVESNLDKQRLLLQEIENNAQEQMLEVRKGIKMNQNVLNRLEQKEKELRGQLDKLKKQTIEAVGPIKAKEYAKDVFTFSDGIKVKTPFPLNSQQTEALQQMADWVKGKESFFTLKGYAGTGKTSTVRILEEYIKKSIGGNIIFSSPTHRANAVLKLNLKGSTVFTLHKTFGLSPMMDLETFSSRDAEFKAQNEPKIGYGDILIIDESSMINDNLFKFISEAAANMGVKVLFMGDPAQIKPVGQTHLSKAFGVNNTYELTKVERTGDNPLLAEITNVRNSPNSGDVMSYRSSENTKGEGVTFSNSQKDFYDKIAEVFTSEEASKNPLLARVVSGTNSNVADVNQRIRKAIYGKDSANEYNKGDLIMGYANYKTDYRTGESLLINSGDYIVTNVSEVKKTKHVGFDVEYYELYLKNALNPDADIIHINILSKNTPPEVFEAIGQEFESLRQQAINAPTKQKKAEGWADLNYFKDQFALPKDASFGTDRYGNPAVKISKTLDYGYAHTIHKSQGGTYKYVFIDSRDLNKFKDLELLKQLEYVALSRAQTHAYVLTSKELPEQFGESTKGWSVEANLGDDIVSQVFTEYDDSIGGFESYQSFAKLDKQIQKNIDFFDSRMAALRFEQRKLTTGDSKRNEEIKKQLADYERRKAEKEVMYQHARALEGLEAIEQMAAKEMDQLQELINSGDVPLYLLEYIRDNLSFWKAVGNPDPYNPHILYTQEELTPEIVERLKIIGAKAGTLDNIQVEKRLEKAMQELPKKLKGDLSDLREQLRHTKDIGFWSKEALDMSAYGDAVLTWIQILEKDAVSQAQVRITDLISKLESAFEPVKNKLGKNYEILQQKHKDGSPTNKLVYRFSPEFFDAARIARSEFENSPSDKKYSNFAKWISENEILMNPIILFPTKLGDEYHWGQSENMYSDYDESMRQAHIAELKATLGEKDYEMYLKRMKDKLETFSFHYAEAKRSFENAGHDAEQVEMMLKDWELENSPYYWAQRVLNDKSLENSKGLIVRNRGYAYAESIPRKFDEKGKETGYYDKNYEKIQADPQLAEFYEQLLDITSQLSEILPPHKRRELGINGLPFLRKDVTELFSRGNWFGMTTELFDQLVEMTRTQDFGDTDTQERDPFTGNVKYKAKLHLDTGEQAIKDIVQSKMTKYEIDNASEIKKLSSGEVTILKDRLNLQFRKEAIAALQKDRSEDLLTTMKAYIMTAVMYRHKANIEDTLNLMSQIAEDRSAFVMKDGVIQTDDEGKPVLQGVAQNKIDVLRFNVKAFLTGRTHKVEGRTKKKILTSKEKTRKQDLDKLLKEIEDKFISGAIDEKVYTTHKEAIEEQIKNLGGYKEAAKYGDIALRFVQLKGIGWNILSGVNNMVFGFTANSIEAAAGRHFDEKDLSIARRMLTSSALTNASFNHYRDAKSKKIRKMTELFDVLKDASTELYKASNRSPIMSKFRAFLPYQITKRTEYINQGQTFIAYMLHQKVKDLQGKEFSLWEAFDDNGEWKTEQFGKMSQNKFSHTKTSVDQLIKRLHGNYDELSPVMGKESIVGRALFQFKSWFPETWRKYYGKEVTDHILGDQYKGRYRTIWDTMLTGDEKSKTAMQTAMEFLRKYLNVTTLGLIPNFAKEDAFSHLSEIDMQNMKRNIHQFIFMANLFMMYYLLKYLADDDDDEKISTVVANLTIHQIARLTGELEMYSSPAQLSNFAKNILPITVITKDLDEIMQASIKTMKGDYTLQSGAYEGWYSIPKEIGESVPFLAPAMRYNSIIQGKSSSQEASIVEAVIAD